MDKLTKGDIEAAMVYLTKMSKMVLEIANELDIDDDVYYTGQEVAELMADMIAAVGRLEHKLPTIYDEIED